MITLLHTSETKSARVGEKKEKYTKGPTEEGSKDRVGVCDWSEDGDGGRFGDSKQQTAQ